MTGFGAAALDEPELKAAVTVRSLNHRFLDITLHVPRRAAALEPEIRRALGERFQRGRVEVAVHLSAPGPAGEAVVAVRPVIEGLVRHLRSLRDDLGLAGDVTPADLVRFPGAFEIAEGGSGLDDGRREKALSLLGQALDQLAAMRSAEGASLEAEIGLRLDGIEGLATAIETAAAEGRSARQEALLERVRTLARELPLDDARIYQEVVRLVERHDVAEELQRLRSHLDQARKALRKAEPCGKRLDFLAQEFAREANTLGSKAVSGAMLERVVDLKGEVERLREQVQNVE